MQPTVRPAIVADEGRVVDLWRACGLAADYMAERLGEPGRTV